MAADRVAVLLGPTAVGKTAVALDAIRVVAGREQIPGGRAETGHDQEVVAATGDIAAAGSRTG